MDNSTDQINLKQLYNIVDWIDVGLVIAVILYYGNLTRGLQQELVYDLMNGDLMSSAAFDYTQFLTLIIENAKPTGIALLVASLLVCTSFIVLTVMMRKRGEIGIIRAAGRIIWNMIWMPLDLYILFQIFLHRIG